MSMSLKASDVDLGSNDSAASIGLSSTSFLSMFKPIYGSSNGSSMSKSLGPTAAFIEDSSFESRLDRCLWLGKSWQQGLK